MGSSSDMHMSPETIGIIPRMIENLFVDVRKREADEPGSSYTIHVQFLEIYGEDIRDLLDVTKKSDVVIRETKEDGVYVTGAREELVTSFEQMMRLLEIGTRQRVTASTKKNAVSSRSHGEYLNVLCGGRLILRMTQLFSASLLLCSSASLLLCSSASPLLAFLLRSYLHRDAGAHDAEHQGLRPRKEDA
jgi:hypothetical protein